MPKSFNSLRMASLMFQSPRGYGAACKAGSKAALASSTILVFMDGDDSDIIADMPRWMTPIERDEVDFTAAHALEVTVCQTQCCTAISSSLISSDFWCV